MTVSEVLFWKRVADDLGIEVVTPLEMVLPSGVRLEAFALRATKRDGDREFCDTEAVP